MVNLNFHKEIKNQSRFSSVYHHYDIKNITSLYMQGAINIHLDFCEGLPGPVLGLVRPVVRSVWEAPWPNG